MTSDLEDRFKRHYNGYKKTTRPLMPFIIAALVIAFKSKGEQEEKRKGIKLPTEKIISTNFF